MKTKVIFALLLSLSLNVGAQTFAPERTGGIYYAYPVQESVRICPDGFVPFYISHYGRHGSRWLPSEERYAWVMSQFEDKSRLTPFGMNVRSRLRKVCRNARGNAGALTSLGAIQQRGIARRMLQNYPEVFTRGLLHTILARSSTTPRCRTSMLAFCEELKSHFSNSSPSTSFTIETRPEDMAYINHETSELKKLAARTNVSVDADTHRFLAALFKDPAAIASDDAHKLLSELHTIASDMQDIPLDISFWDCFSPEEMLAVHEANNKRMTICNGDTIVGDGIAARSSIPLWRNIVSEADSMIEKGAYGASLRFGHDTALFRLLTLLRLRLPSADMEDIVPMAANLQLVFFKSEGRVAKGERNDSVLVLFLLNEKPCRLKGNLSPLTSHLTPLAFPLYSWAELKEAMEQRIHSLEHQRQLTTLNTMVGTSSSTTRSAGLFGKGSEEQGQTLPAVLVPHGQTFWTPQTRTTEKKCVAPYYYQDTLFQGIRASHWLVGGCTQDYGSFTINAHASQNDHSTDKSHTSGELVEQTSHDGVPFTHADETSHPHYYAISLPTEQLRIELTGLSHSAMLRITPLKDGSLTVTIEANSDEQEGGVSIDSEHHEIYGYNPVHRIYQGWGESAGFSGHFVVRYDVSPISVREEQQKAELTFNGKKGHSIVLRMATSFTSRDGAERNLETETAGISFEQMEQRCLDLWMRHIHTIDVDDPDTARVQQFYGALYRASFLPREMSDCDGRFVPFNRATKSYQIVDETANFDTTIVRYGDFSLWDTYRALHPLLCIIAPKKSDQMMQSLVSMAEEGGWMPIFPCWNSYTAAMIGDHASSVLADAYVKGIRNFDATSAYCYMYQNATKKPHSIDDYLNGKGRRALDSYLKYGYIPLEDSVKEAFHQQEQTSRTLEYAYDDFCVAQMAKELQVSCSTLQVADTLREQYQELMDRSENWRNVINPSTGWADGRYLSGLWLNNSDLTKRQPYITEGAVCHYTWYVPQNIPGLIELLGGSDAFMARLDSMFSEGRYWHGNEPCHQLPWLYSLAGRPDKTYRQVTHILHTEYNDSPGGLSGNDDAGQMSAWQVFAHLGFYPVCPGTPQYVLGGSQFEKITLNQSGRLPFVIRRATDHQYRLNGRLLDTPILLHDDLLHGGVLELP